MFNLINKLSRVISFYLSKNDEEDYFDYYNFAIVSILNFLLYTIVGIAVSLIFDYFPLSILSTIVIMGLRRYGGGVHGRTNLECHILTQIFLFICGTSTVLFHRYYMIMFILSNINFLGIGDIPKYTKTAKQHSLENQVIIKEKYIKTFCLFYFINGLCVILTATNIVDLSIISFAISISLVVNKLCLTDYMMKIFEK